MIYIIILIFIIHFLAGSGDIILACGIFAFFSDDKEKFSWDKFNILGLFNDSRGGDSCGMVTEGFTAYGIGALSDYKDFLPYNGIPATKHKTVLGHTRKASVGQVVQQHAQPVVLSSATKFIKKRKGVDKDLKEFINTSKTNEGDIIIFAGVHNGTIINWRDLADKYHIDTTEKNDSQVLLEIIYRRGFEVLIDYIGSAALIWYDFVKDTGYAFHGESPYAYASRGTATMAMDEKPLYLYRSEENAIYLSSLEESLKFIGGKTDTISEVEPNTLYVIKNGVIIDKQLYDRATLSSQHEKIAEYHYSNTTPKSYNNFWPGGSFNDEGYDTDDYDYHKTKDKAAHFFDGVALNPYLFSYAKPHIFNEQRDYSIAVETAFFWKGRFCFESRETSNVLLLNGSIYLNSLGKRVEKDSPGGRLFYFIDGVMLDSKESYAKLVLTTALIKDPGELAKELATKSIYPVHSFPRYLYEKSQTGIRPVKEMPYQNFYTPGGVITDTESFSKTSPTPYSTYFTGKFQPLFSRRTYLIERGDVIGINESSTFKSLINSSIPKTLSPVEEEIKRLDKEIEDLEDEYEYSKLPKKYHNEYGNNMDDLTYQQLVVEELSTTIGDGIESVRSNINDVREVSNGTELFKQIDTRLTTIMDEYIAIKEMLEDEKSI